MKQFNVMQNIENLDQVLNLHPSILKNAESIHVFFNKENELYFSVLETEKDSQEKARWGFSKHEVLKKLVIYSYQLLQEKKELDENDYNPSDQDDHYQQERVGKLLYCIEDSFNYSTQTYQKMLFIACLNIEQTHNEKGLGKNLLQLANYYAYKDNCEQIQLSAHPFSYLVDKMEVLDQFYTKAGFKMEETGEPSIKNGTKYILNSHINNLKEKMINFPTSNRNYTVLIPEKNIVSSSVKDIEKE